MVRGSQLGKAFSATMIMSPKDVAELGCPVRLRGESLADRARQRHAAPARGFVLALGGMVNVRG